MNSLLVAQHKFDFFSIARADSVFLFLTVPPKSNEGFLVYRRGPLPSNQGYELLTKDLPVMPVIDPEEAMAMAGEDWEIVSKAVESEDPFEILRKLRGSEFTGGLLSLLSMKIAQITGRLFIDYNLEVGKEYNYKIVYVDSRMRVKDSLSKKILVKEVYPVAPTKLKAIPGDKNVKLTWDYQKWKGNFEDLAVQFKIYRKSGGEEFRSVLDRPLIRDDEVPREYTDWWLEENKQYSYYITAVDPIGRESQPSEIISVVLKDITPPAIPQNLIAEAGDAVIALSWNMSLELDVAGYNVYRTKGLDQKFEKINIGVVPIERPFYFDSTAQNGVQYFYAVSALDKSGNESKLSNPVGSIAEDRTPPDPPTNLIYKIENRIIKLSWSSAKARDVEGYHIYRGENVEVQPRITIKPIKITTFADSGYQKKGLTPGGNFVVSLTAIDRSGNESQKVTVFVKIPDDEPPMPPMNFFAENIDGRYVEISCGPSPSPDVEKYTVFRKTSTTSAIELNSFNIVPFKFRDTSILKGEQYLYYAIAFDSAGNMSIPGLIDTVFVRDFSPPPSSRNIRAKVTDKGVLIEWERVIDFDLAGYNIYRAEIPTGIYEKLNALPVKDLKFIDANGKNHHFYKVRSVDTSGNESYKNEPVKPD